jgi:NTP pyrophosphatase (non-canonical NTP hydrolase)
MESYEDMVRRLNKPAREIWEKLQPVDVDLIHAAMGLAGEAGEVLDLIKKVTINGHLLDVEKLVKELGDIEFYMERMRQILDISREIILNVNQTKLTNRYPAGYSDEASIRRADDFHDGAKR